MVIITKGQTLKTVTEVLEREPTSIPSIQDGTKPTKWDAQFQAYGIDGKVVLEALKKLTAYTVLRDNRPETDYLR